MAADIDTINCIRKFNRYYTKKFGLLNQHYLGSFSLTEARILFDLREVETCTAQQLSNRLEIDKSYLSRVLKKLIKEDIVCKTESPDDKRSYLLNLSENGRHTVLQLIDESNYQIFKMLLYLTPIECEDLRKAISTIEYYFNGQTESTKDKDGVNLWTLM